MVDFVAIPLCNFGTPKYCIQARNTSFASFDVSKVREMLRNTLKHHLGSSGVEWIFSLRYRFCNFSTQKYYIHARNISFALFDETKVCEMVRYTRKHRLGSNGLISLRKHFFVTLVPKIVHSGLNHKFCLV